MRPPSTRNVVPVTYEDSSLARNSAAFTISRGLREPAHRQVDAPPLERAGSSRRCASRSGVSTGPGQSALTRTPWRANCDGELAAHREHRAFRGRVGDLRGGRADDRDERGDVDHRAAAALEQVRDAVLAAEEDALRVDVLHALPGLDARSRAPRRRRRARCRRCCRARRRRRSARRSAAYRAATLSSSATSTSTRRPRPAERDRLLGRLGVPRPRRRPARPPR